MLAKAIQIAATAHLNQVDKRGKPYILHPLWVMNKVRHLGEDYMIVAVLHDVLEDSDWTINRLIQEGFSLSIVASLDLLDFRNKDYDQRIKQISFDPKARAVYLIKIISYEKRLSILL